MNLKGMRVTTINNNYHNLDTAGSFDQLLRMAAAQDREQDELRDLRRREQRRTRTHTPNRKNKRSQAKKSRRANR